MRIGLAIDALSPQLSGIGRYVWELVKGLQNHPEIDDLQLFRFNRWYRSGDQFLISPKPPRTLIPRAARPYLMKRGFRNRLFHGPNYFVPEHAERSVVTVHDLSVLRYPEFHPLQRRLDFDRHFERSVNQASHLITDSEFVKAEMVELLGLDPNRITAIPLGVDEAFFQKARAPETAALARDSNVGAARYALCVATFEPRKGLHHAVRAFVEAKQRYPELPCDKLIITGSDGWENADQRSEIQTWIAKGLVELTGYLSEEKLLYLYKGATVFLYPSAYEGFGLPPLEAMASGVPVIMSPAGSLQEISGTVAAMVDPADTDKFAETIAKTVVDDDKRSELISRGTAHARNFTWDSCIQKTLEIYRRYSC